MAAAAVDFALLGPGSIRSRRGTIFVPLPKLERNQTSDPRSFQEVGAECENFKKRTEVAERHCDTPSE